LTANLYKINSMIITTGYSALLILALIWIKELVLYQFSYCRITNILNQ